MASEDEIPDAGIVIDNIVRDTETETTGIASSPFKPFNQLSHDQKLLTDSLENDDTEPGVYDH